MIQEKFGDEEFTLKRDVKEITKYLRKRQYVDILAVDGQNVALDTLHPQLSQV